MKAESDLNELRLLAHEIIRQLYKKEAVSHLRLLLNHCQSSITEIEEAKEAEGESDEKDR